jgi:hypothetical protein
MIGRSSPSTQVHATPLGGIPLPFPIPIPWPPIVFLKKLGRFLLRR